MTLYSDITGQMVATLVMNIVCKLVKLLNCIPETKVTLCVNYTQKKKSFGVGVLSVCDCVYT